MNIVFVVPDYNYLTHYMPQYKGSFHHGVAYICAYLKNNGHHVSLIHLLKPKDDEEFIKEVKSKSPGIIAFTSFTHQFQEVKRLVSLLKKNLNIPIVCGGVHCTIDAERALSESDLDMVCIGEGEETMRELAEVMESGKDASGISGIWLKQNGNIIRNPVRPLLEDLDMLPFPDWDIFHYDELTESLIQKRVAILASRGCPKNCSFCSNHAIKSVYPNKERYVRTRSPRKVLEEIEAMLRKYPHLESVCFLDDTVGLDVHWLQEFSGLYKSKFSLPVDFNTRVEIVNDDKRLECFQRMGVRIVGLGFESGDESIRRMLNRQISNEAMIRAVKRCHEVGIKVLTYNIVGFPYENLEKALKTVQLNVEANSDIMHVSIFQPYPNTDAYKICVKEGFINDGDFCEGFFERSILTQKTITNMDILFLLRFFQIYAVFFKISKKLQHPFGKIFENTLLFTFKNRASRNIFLFFYTSFLSKLIFNKRSKKMIKGMINNMLKDKRRLIKKEANDD